jgi:hypothetical protein
MNNILCGLIYKILLILDYSRLFGFNINIEYQGKASYKFNLLVSVHTLNMVVQNLTIFYTSLEYDTNMNQI